MHLNHIKNIAKATFAFAIALTAMTTVTTEAQAQDLIARQAPVDRKMKVVDSVVINKAIKKQLTLQQTSNLAEIDFENAELYSSWDTKAVHCYGTQQTPEHYRIDLRGFAMPTPSRVITSNYGYRASFGRMHKGLDIKVYIGDTISSAFDGKVRIVNYEAKGYGNYVVIRHNNGLETIYGHLSKHLCKVGDVVRAGQPIGLGGNTGRSTGSHLHFETRIVGEAINPALLFDFVHQDVTGDFFDYRRNGRSSATARTQTASTATVRSTGTPKATATPAPKVVATPKENAPAKSPAKDAATAKATKVKTKAASTEETSESHAKSKASSAKATAKAEPAKERSSRSSASTKESSSKSSSSSKTSSSKSSSSKEEKSSSSHSHSKAKTDEHHSSRSSKATAKEDAHSSKSTHGHSHKA